MNSHETSTQGADEEQKAAESTSNSTSTPRRYRPRSELTGEGCIQVLGCFILWFCSWWVLISPFPPFATIPPPRLKKYPPLQSPTPHSHFHHRGLANTYGIFQTYYTRTLPPSTSPSSISWIGSIQALLLLLGGLFTGAIFDMGYARSLIAAGTFLFVFGMMMLSLCERYWEIFLAQGVLMGLGMGCFIVPCLAVLAQWFEGRRALAMGVAVSGSGFGELDERGSGPLYWIGRVRVADWEISNRWCALSGHLHRTAAEDWISLDCEDDRLHHACFACRSASLDEAKAAAADETEDGRLGCSPCQVLRLV